MRLGRGPIRTAAHDPNRDASGAFNSCGVSISPETQGWNFFFTMYWDHFDVGNSASRRSRWQTVALKTILRAQGDTWEG